MSIALPCSDCGCELSPNPKRRGTRCRACNNRSRARPRPILAVVLCPDCGASVRMFAGRKGTKCKSCTSRETGREKIAFAQAAHRKLMQDPAARAARSKSLTAYCADPAVREKRRQAALRRVEAGFALPIYPAGAPARVKAGQSVTETRLAWCPPAYRDAYRDLNCRQRIPADQAKRAILDQIAHDRAKAPRRPLSFEEQLAAVRAGAKLVPTFVKPRVEPMFTLGGATGDINA